MQETVVITKREYFWSVKILDLENTNEAISWKDEPNGCWDNFTVLCLHVEDCIICYSFHDDPSKLYDRGKGYTVKFTVWIFLFLGLHLESLTTKSAGLYFSLLFLID